MNWGSTIELETKKRIDIAVWAYAYEYHDDPLVSDAMFDEECGKINLDINTTNPQMDKWFKKEFSAFTGQWVYKHPNKEGLERIYKLKRGLK